MHISQTSSELILIFGSIHVFQNISKHMIAKLLHKISTPHHQILHLESETNDSSMISFTVFEHCYYYYILYYSQGRNKKQEVSSTSTKAYVISLWLVPSYFYLDLTVAVTVSWRLVITLMPLPVQQQMFVTVN